MWLQTIFHHFKTYPDYFEIQHSNSSAFSILYINKQHKIIPWSNKENKHLAVLFLILYANIVIWSKGRRGQIFQLPTHGTFSLGSSHNNKNIMMGKKTPATWLFCLHYDKSPQCFQTPSSSFLNSGIACLRLQSGETFSLRNVDLKD